MGGGRRTFFPNTTVDPETKEVNPTKGRRDGKNLVEVILVLTAICKSVVKKHFYSDELFNALLLFV